MVDTVERVCEIIADVTLNPVREITERSTTKTVDGWDEAAHVSIMAAIEMDFGASFSDDETPTLDSVRKIVEALRLQSVSPDRARIA